MTGDGQVVKCVIWDLDDTLWDGTLLEGCAGEVSERTVAAVRTLDEHGILQAVASRNDEADARRRLTDLGLWDYFVSAQISWGAKSLSVRRVVEELAIGADTVVFVDDSEFERAEVAHEIPAVRCLSPGELLDAVGSGRIFPEVVTADAAMRRTMYLTERRRRAHEAEFSGPSVEFLRSLDMRMSIRPMVVEDLARASELTVRTHQLNTTGVVYSVERLRGLLDRPDTLVLVATLDDRFGTYGQIGLGVIDREPETWRIRLLLMSCRVLGRNVGSALIGAISNLARAAGARVRADLVPNDRNRQMQITYRLNGFVEAERQGDLIAYELRTGRTLSVPDYVAVEFHGSLAAATGPSA